ncbi:MAG: type II toxin-antitoxin system ParD family antitoxin [Roseococcus sp.]
MRGETRKGLRLFEEREARLAALRESLDAAVAAGGAISDEELGEAIATHAAALPGSLGWPRPA